MLTILVVLALLLGPATSAEAQVSVHISMPGVSIGFNAPTYPDLVRVPGYPVYYARRANANYFFFDGVYWIYWNDHWYASSWYNGPWRRVGPEYVPLFVLRVPVRYYRRPPAYFRGWNANAPPRWGDHWGRSWESHREGWDEWDRHSVPSPAPLPVYQRRYSGNTYPRAVAQQDSIRATNYRYEPREMVTRQVMPAAQTSAAPVQVPRAKTQPALVTQERAQPVRVPPARPQQERAQATAQPPRPQGSAPQGREAQTAPQPKSQLVRPQGNAPQERGQARPAPPQDRAPEPKAAPRDKGPEDRGQEKKAPPPEKGRENQGEKEKRGEDRR